MATGLSRTLTFTQLAFYGVGTMVGAGIYSVIGAAAGEAGYFLWVSFIFAGIAALLTALSYAELSSMFQKAGAEYQYLKHAFPEWRLLSFLGGSLIAMNAAATSATVSLAFAGYLNVFLAVPQAVTAYALLTLCTLVNIWGIRQSTWVSIAMICVEVVGLVIIVAAGFIDGEPSRNWAGGMEAFHPGGVFGATALIFFVFIGFEDVANLSEEAKDAQRNVPRALLASVFLTSCLYLLVALAVAALAEPEALAGSDSPLSLAVERAWPGIGKVLAVTALFATASTALITLVSISRMLLGMARDRIMPAPVASILPSRQTPWVAALVLAGLAGLLIPFGEVKTVASISSFGILLVFIGIQSAVIALRLRAPEKERGFRVPLSVGRVPVPPVIGILMAAALLTQFEPVVYLTGGAIISAALLVYRFAVAKRLHPGHPSGQ